MHWALQIGDDRQAASQCRRLKYGPRLCFRNGPAAGSTRDWVAASRPWPRERTGWLTRKKTARGVTGDAGDTSGSIFRYTLNVLFCYFLCRGSELVPDIGDLRERMGMTLRAISSRVW
jgi:hypothetical protein